MTMVEDGGGGSVKPPVPEEPNNMFARNAAALEAFRHHYPGRKLQPRGSDAAQDAFLDGYVRALVDSKGSK